MTLTSGTLRLLGAATLAALLLSCGSTQEAGGGGGPVRTVVDAEGTSVEVPEQPERVVTLSEPTLDGALALGVTPVGTVTGRGQSGVPNYLADLASDIELLGGVAQPNYEAIGSADPDLILVDGTSINNNPDAVDALRRIAPVVYTGYAGGSWRDNFALVSDALNLADEGERVVAEYDERAKDVAERLAVEHADDTFSIARWQGGSASLILKELPPGMALTDLGLRRPVHQDRNGRGHSEPVSVENLSQIDADYLFFGTLGGSSVDHPDAGGAADTDAAREALTEAEKVPGFSDLQAVREDHVIVVDGSLWTSTGGPLLMNRIVDAVEEALL